MKRIYSALFALAGTLAIASTAAFAQGSLTLSATIPFSFQTASQKVMQPGDYRITRNGAVWRFAHFGTNEQAQVLAASAMQGDPDDKPQLVFACHGDGSHCTLQRIKAGHGETGAYWPQSKHNKADATETARLVVIPVRAAQ